MSRLTDEELDGLQRFVNGDDGPRPIHIVWTDRALAELRERRSHDLNAEDVEALTTAREIVQVALVDARNTYKSINPLVPRAVSILDRLLARANGGEK